MNRSQFFKQSLGVAATSMLIPDLFRRTVTIDPEPYKMELIKDFVGAGHGRIERLKELVADFPNIIYCRYDWGNGDFEDAIEAAAHVGNKEIANFLIEKGARPNLFVLTMLGRNDLIVPILEAYPILINGLGAHGFTLLHHALKGGEDASEMVTYLASKGLTETQVKIK